MMSRLKNTGGPSARAAVFLASASVSGRAEFFMASSKESKNTMIEERPGLSRSAHGRSRREAIHGVTGRPRPPTQRSTRPARLLASKTATGGPFPQLRVPRTRPLRTLPRTTGVSATTVAACVRRSTVSRANRCARRDPFDPAGAACGRGAFEDDDDLASAGPFLGEYRASRSSHLRADAVQSLADSAIARREEAGVTQSIADAGGVH
jgi:hypothetical protein